MNEMLSGDSGRVRVYPELSVKKVTIGPELAEEWLGKNVRNRDERPTGSEAYSRDVSAGDWMVTGDTIKFDWFGDLLDGQHRLLAVVASGKAIETLVVWGIDPKAQPVMDSGMSRSFRDKLRMEGVNRSQALSPLVRRVRLWKLGERVDFSRSRVTISELQRTYDQHPELIHCAEYVHALPGRPKVSGSLTAFLYWVFLHANPEEAKVFIAKFISGAGLEDGDPILALRDWVDKTRAQGGRNIDGPMLWRAAMVWNNWMVGRTISKIQLPRGGIAQDNFPVLRTVKKVRGGFSVGD